MDNRFNPWLAIWIRPRATIRHIINENPNRSLWFLAALQGFCSILNKAQGFGLGENWSLLAIFSIAIVLSPLWGYAFFSIWSAVVYWTGKLFKGTANFQAVRAAYAWSCVPFTVKIVLWLILTFFLGKNLFISEFNPDITSNSLLFTLFSIVVARLVATIWSLVIYFNALAEVQGYSVLKAILNTLITAILFTMVAWVLWSLAMMYLFIPEGQR